MPGYTVERNNPDVLTVRHLGVKAGWEQWYLLCSDVHWDNPYCDRDLFRRHLEQAKERGAGVLCIGDFYCAMQGKWDKRGDKSALRPEHAEGDYLDALVSTAATWLEPYRENIVQLCDGNHETAILKHHETSLLARLCDRLGVEHGGYAGFVRMLFARGDNKGHRTKRTLYYHHGSGGDAPVTHGVIGTNRRGVQLRNVDIVASGHNHNQYALPVVQVGITDSGQVYRSEQWHIGCPTYKQEHRLRGGFHVERGAPPKPIGAWWMRFFFDTRFPGYVATEFVPAK